jgi:plastocyanin
MSHRSSFAVLALAALAAGSAEAATVRVLVGPGNTQTFSPRNVIIRTGDTVEWANQNVGGMSHNVVADDDSFTSGGAAAGPWTFRHTFAAAGTIGFYCAPHGGPGGTGMSGTVTVSESIELGHGSDMSDDLLGAPDRYRIGQKPFTSYEVVVDPLAGNPALELARLSGVTSAVLQNGQAVSAGIDQVQSLRWQNSTSTANEADRIRVGSATCGTDCTAPDLYRVRVYETTLSVPRYNQTGTQATVVILQNTTDSAINGTVYFWTGAGALANAGGTTFTIAPRSAFVLGGGAVTGVPGTSGTITVAHDGRYGDLSGKAVAVEPGTGFTFDTPAVARPR